MQPDPLKGGSGKARLNLAGYFRVLIRKPIYLIAFLVILIVFLAGSWYGSRKTVQSGLAPGRRILHYVDPMNPAHTSPEPGMAPCGMKMEPVYAEGEGQEAPPANLPPGAVKVTAQKQQLIGVRLGVVEKAPFKHTLRALGRVAVDETRIYRLNAFVDGWILKVFNNSTGSLVMKDEALAAFYSRDFITAEQSYLYQLSSLDRLKTAGQLIDSQHIGLTSQIRASEENLENLGMSKVQIKELARTRRLTQDILINAPVTSFILTRNVSPGQKISRNDDLYKLADLSHVWILADLYDDEAKYAQPGVKVRVILPRENKTVWARVSDILPQVDPVTRTYKVRLEADNLDYALRPDMFVDLEFPVTLPAAVTIPADALIDTGLKKAVLISRGNGYFEPREVEIGWRFGDRVEIVKGLEPGETIVISGNFLIDSESRMRLAAAGIFGEVTKDPVCGLNVDESKAKAAGFQSTFENQTYYFCSEECKQHFEKTPGRYAAKPGQAAEAAGGKAPVEAPAAKAPESYVAKATGPAGPVIAMDPVSKLEVDTGYAATLGLKRAYEGKTYFFRHYSSMEQFDKDPKSFLAGAVPIPAPTPPGQPPATGGGSTEIKDELFYHGQEHYLVKALGLDQPQNPGGTLKETPVTDKDPVCGVHLGEDVVRGLAYKTPYKGKLYYFCSDECKREFDLNPERYAGKTAAATREVAAGLEIEKPREEHVHPGQIPPPGGEQEKPGPNQDPVCGVDLKKGGLRSSFPKTTYQEKIYYFCSDKCKKEFDQDPERYLHKPKPSPVVSPPVAPPGAYKDARGRPLPGSMPPLAAPPAKPGASGRQQ